MTEMTELMRLKYAVQSLRQRMINDCDAIEALIDRALPNREPGHGLRVPSGREARKKYWKENGVTAMASKSHGRRISKNRKP